VVSCGLVLARWVEVSTRLWISIVASDFAHTVLNPDSAPPPTVCPTSNPCRERAFGGLACRGGPPGHRGRSAGRCRTLAGSPQCGADADLAWR
jgi:hypothetical protein